MCSFTAIKNKPVRNEDPKDAKLREYQAEIERLRTLIERRKAAERRKKNRPQRRNRAECEWKCKLRDHCEWTY